MKKGIHPEQKVCKVTCACGNSFEIKNIKTELQIETCPKCHSAYTGKRMEAKAGNVQKFKEKYGLK